jgi:hypothetical protein
MLALLAKLMKRPLPHIHTWQEDGGPFRRVCSDPDCEQREMLMQNRYPSAGEPALQWKKV